MTPRPRRPRPPWCGRCHEPTRLIDNPDGSASRCPICHAKSTPKPAPPSPLDYQNKD